MTIATPLSSGALAQAIARLEQLVAEAPNAELPTISGELARLEALTWLRLRAPEKSAVNAPGAIEADRYLTMQEVKKRTGLSLSHLYEMGRTGELPVMPMGRGRGGKKPRGYRVLLSELLAWEARRKKSVLADRVCNMLTSFS